MNKRLGLWLTERIRRNYDHRWLFGITIRSVTFADHRSGTAAIQVVVQFGVWGRTFYPIKWPLPPYQPQRVITLQEQIAAVHGNRNDEDDEDDW